MNTAKAFLSDSIKIHVKITAGPHMNEVFVINKDSFSVGRGAENDIILINDPKLSRNHIKASLKGADLHIENLSTRNPIMYKDKTENNVDLKPHDRIRMGDTEMELQWNATSLEKTLMATEVSYQLTVATSTSQSDGPTVVKPDFSALTQVVGVTPKSFPALVTQQSPPSSSLKALHPLTDKNNFTPNASTPHQGGAIYTPTPNKAGAAASTNKAVKSSGNQKNYPAASKNKYSQHSYSAKSSSSNKGLIIGLCAIGLFVLVISLGGDKKPKKIAPLKDTNQISAELTKSNQVVDDYVKEKKLLEDGRMDRIYESAQSYYIKGFRDYRQGQYSRAIVSFQAALSFDPGHVLSKKYLLQSVKKHSEVVQFNLDQAKRYREKSNYRLCKSSAKQVIVMALRKDQTDPMYKEGKKIFDECDILSKGRF